MFFTLASKLYIYHAYSFREKERVRNGWDCTTTH